MNNIINYNHKLINIVWNDRGIKIIIIYNILKYYNKIKNKNIIIDNKDYRIFSKIMFPELNFKKFNLNDTNYNNNFYFNIRRKLVKKDIFIDSIHNYIGKKIFTKNIYLIPWFDINDPIISFRYTKKKYLHFNKEYNKIIHLGNLYRNQGNELWDSIFEQKILNKYIIYKYKNFKLVENINLVYIKFFNLLNKYYLLKKIPIIIEKPIRNTFVVNNNEDETVIIDSKKPIETIKEKPTKPIIQENPNDCSELQEKILLLEKASLINYN